MWSGYTHKYHRVLRELRAALAVTMRHSLIFLVMVWCLFLLSAWAGSPALSEDDDMAIERVLKMLNKPYVKSFKDEYDVVFDCVDIYKQPALDHPLLKNHTIQILPRSSTESTGSKSSTAEPIRFSRQESCPDGTVPIRRTLKQDLVRSNAHLERYRLNQDTSGVAGQHFAMMLMDSEKGSKLQGAGAVLEVDSPYVPPDQSSSAQIILLDNSSDKIGCIQTGWHVDPKREGDGQTRFMTYWTADDYQTTGCLNMLCPGFVLTSQTAAPGMAFPTGTLVGISMSKTESGDWYVFLNQQSVGYFPKQIFNNMDGATEAQMGGITYAPPGQKSPPMGNGVAPSSDTNITASTFTHLEPRGATVARAWVTKDVDQAIYNIVMTSNSYTGPQGMAFQYGGPGGA